MAWCTRAADAGNSSGVCTAADGTEEAAFRFLDALHHFKLAVSLGANEWLAQHPGTMTHADVPPERQREMGITPGLVRLSVGIEHPDDLIADLEQAFEAVGVPQGETAATATSEA